MSLPFSFFSEKMTPLGSISCGVPSRAKQEGHAHGSGAPKSTLAHARISAAMTESAARPLILTSGLLLALFDLVALLPGNPDVSGSGGIVVVVAVQALIVWRLLYRSGLAWFFGVTISSLYVLSLILAGMPSETTLAVTGLLTLTQVALLCTPPVLAYVWRRD
jgi:hypothetical protein